MKWGKSIVRLVCLLPFLLPSLSFCHAESDAAGFMSGFKHPLLGMDHLLAMLGVGVVSARIGGRYIWIVPGIFVAFMILGGIIGATGIGFPMTEIGIAISVIMIGLNIGFNTVKNAPIRALIMGFVAFFGTLHGHAHGVEMPGSASPIYYSFGFATCTCLIHLLGVYIGQIPEDNPKLEKLPAYAGRIITVAGCYILYTHLSA
jgi:urease accessory protein